MSKSQTVVLARAVVEPRPELTLPRPAAPATLPPRREPRTAERIRDALLQWLEEEV